MSFHDLQIGDFLLAENREVGYVSNAGISTFEIQYPGIRLSYFWSGKAVIGPSGGYGLLKTVTKKQNPEYFL